MLESKALLPCNAILLVSKIRGISRTHYSFVRVLSSEVSFKIVLLSIKSLGIRDETKIKFFMYVTSFN